MELYSKYYKMFKNRELWELAEKYPSWDHDHASMAKSYPGKLEEVNVHYNLRFPNTPVPQYEKVLICGGGPSFDHIPEGPYDAVLLTLPIVEAVIDKFECPKVITDAETDGFVAHAFYPAYVSRPDVLKYWTRRKFVDEAWCPISVSWCFDDALKSSGALALDFARRCNALKVDIIGMDLNGCYEVFKPETMKLMSLLSEVSIL